MRSRILSIFLALLVVSSGVAAPVAADTPEQCGAIENFIHDLITFQNVNEGDSPCSTHTQIDNAVQEVREDEANQTHIDLYSAASGQKAQAEALGASYDNYLQDSQSAAWMKAQVAVAEAYENGSSKSEAKVAAKEAIADYYSVRAVNLIEAWNSSAYSAKTFRNTATNESLGTVVDSSNESGNQVKDGFESISTGGTMSLPNGTTHGVIFYRVNKQGGTKNVHPDTGSYLTGHTDGEANVTGIEIYPPNSNYDFLQFVTFNKWESRWEKINTQNDALQSEADTFVENTYGDFESGEINASDVISANTAMFEYGTTSTTENKSLYNSVGALTLMGFDTPNLTNSGTMDVAYKGNTYTGVLLAQNAPGGSWDTGQTYNTSNIDGPVFMAVTTGDKIDFEDNTTFTIEQMRAKDGSELNTTETTKYVYKTSNTSELLEVQDNLQTLRAELESRETSGAGGSGGSGIGQNTIIAAAALAGAALLFGRSNN